jgi:ABC-type lipoprotein release transport system permease subunit
MFNNLRVAFFLAIRQLFRTSKWSSTLIVMIMTLIFLNLVAVSGILVGLIEGSSAAYRSKMMGDLIVSPLENKKTVTQSDEIINILHTLPEVKAVSARFQEGGQVESNYNNRDAGKRREVASMQIVGIKPQDEQAVTKIGNDIIEGEFLSPDDTGKIVLGKNTLGKYAQVTQDVERSLGEVKIGDTVLVTMAGKTNEFVVKGILSGKTDVTRQGFISDLDLKRIVGKTDNRASSINVRVSKVGDEDKIKQVLVDNNLNEEQKVQTYAEGEPSFVKDLKKVFSILGWVIGGIGIVVAAVVIFIIIYINAITKRKFIGIMKGIGIRPDVIQTAYVMQSIFYGILGSLIGALIVYFVLIPAFIAHPIDFPFSDGIMVAPYADTLQKFAILMFATVLGGLIPSWLIVRQNTLSAILGR